MDHKYILKFLPTYSVYWDYLSCVVPWPGASQNMGVLIPLIHYMVFLELHKKIKGTLMVIYAINLICHLIFHVPFYISVVMLSSFQHGK